MRKCPNCNVKTVKVINNTFLTYSKTLNCQNCETKVGVSKKWTNFISVVYSIFVIILFVLHLPIDKNILQFTIILLSSGILMLVIQLFFVPYEVREVTDNK